MPVPASINDLSTTAGSNYPAGSESPAVLDNYQRAHASFIAQLRDEKLTATDSGWVTPTFENSFSADATYPLQYRVKNGFLSILGAAKRNTTPTTGLTIFTLPSGSRPNKPAKYANAFAAQDSPLYIGLTTITVGSTGAVNAELPMPSSGTAADNYKIYINTTIPL